ncbi:unnamed protein product [Didymodactylos carnosus]|uniref:Geminivirus AL1 replication-associated protein central domain-containing protein n=1 Tax=Didymodactylos carnosus TaxID=1234261 RepID=A0A815DSY2_9BILA|nr:unnamed protein product [Didymodactylos carnosus]CAF4126845.1 unnamed protein product [Didymodactylos carnosus]
MRTFHVRPITQTTFSPYNYSSPSPISSSFYLQSNSAFSPSTIVTKTAPPDRTLAKSKRLSKHHFQFNNVPDNKDFNDIYQQILHKYKNNLKYLCVSSTSSAPPCISIHLQFRIRPNYTRLFLQDTIPQATRQDYEQQLDDDEFNVQIKHNNDDYTESCPYKSTRTKSVNKNHFQRRSDYAARALQQQTVAEGMNILQTAMPYDYLVHSTSMRNTLNQSIGQRQRLQQLVQYQPPFPISSFSIPSNHAQKIDDWLATDFHERIHDRLPTRTRRKTSFARTLGTHMFHRGCFSLSEWSDEVDYMILDDIPYPDIKQQAKQLLTAPGEVHLTDKYHKKEKKHNNKPCIYLMNYEDIGGLLSDTYWIDNGVIVQLSMNEKLFA